MKFVKVSDISELKNREGFNCVSLIMPTPGKGADYQSNRILFKTLLGEAREELKDLGVNGRYIDPLLEPAERLEGSRPYWKSRDAGLAAYLSEGFFRTYSLPFDPERRVIVSGSFDTSPLEYLIARNRRYFLLALGLGDNRLFEASPFHIREIPSDSLPGGMAETLKFDVFEKHLQGYSTARADYQGARMAFHGHGSVKEERGTNIRRYVKNVASGMSRLLAGETSPLVVATLPYLLPDFAEACRYPHLTEGSVPVDPGHMDIDELHRRSLERMEEAYRREIGRALESYGVAAAAGNAITDDEELVRAAAGGRIDMLLLEPDYRVFGSYDPVTDEVSIRRYREPGEMDLSSFTVEQTLLKGGRVLTLDSDRMPDGSGMAALLRY